MGFFSKKIELNEKIVQLETENKDLLNEKQKCEQAKDELCEKNKKLSAELEKYYKEFIDTGLECELCYTVLHMSFKYCPNCGYPIIHEEKIDNNDKAKYENQFTIEDDTTGCIITHYDISGQKTVIIPSKLYDRPVIGVVDSAFLGCNEIEEVIFEEGCQYIGNNAFLRCKGLKKIHLPKSLKEIGERAFCLCESLEEIILPSNVEIIGNKAFESCTKLKNVVFSEKLRCISEKAFYKTALKEVRLPIDLGVIESYAFAYTALEEVYLPENLQIVENFAFYECKNLKKIVVYSNVEIFSKSAVLCSPAIIYCSEGSAGHLAARKIRRDTVFIEAVPEKKKVIYVKSIYIDFGKFLKKQHPRAWDMEWFLENIDVQKVDKWPWHYTAESFYNACIRKCFTYEDAMELKKTLMNYGVSRVDFELYNQEK